MNTISTLPDVKMVTPKIFSDERGFFYECYNQRELEKEIGVSDIFVQDNFSRSYKNVLRGLHYQLPHAQGKLVRVISGTVFDVAVDLRKSSPTFGKWAGKILSDKEQQILWIPEGFAHGFLVLSDQADFHYKTTDFYEPSAERCIKWDDPDLAINWPIEGLPLLSKKDSSATPFKDAELFP